MIDKIDYEQLTKVTQQDLDEGVWDAEHKGLYSKDGKRFLQYMRPKNLERGVPDTFQLKTGVKVICEKAFSKGFFPLTSFVIPKSVVAIGDEAFQEMHLPQHANFTITKGLKYIGYKILGNYGGILNLIIEEGVKEIDLSYVLDCAPAVTLYLPSTLESIGDKGFGEVDNTEHIHLADGNKHFCMDNGILYNYDKTKLLRCPVTKRGEVIIPEGVTTIGTYAFRLSGYKYAIDAEPERKLSIVLPQSLTKIELGAFRHTWIDSIFIPSNVSEIEEGAFEDAIHLKIEMSPENKNFEVCNNLLIDKRSKKVLYAMSNKVEIPNGIMEIADHALGHLQSKRIVIPEGVTRIGKDNLNLYKALRISLPSTLKDITRSSFWGFFGVPHTIEVPTGMGKEFKEKLYDFGDYDISSYIQEKKNSIIYDSSDLLKISEDGKTVLGVYDQFVTAIVIPYGVEVIGDCAFNRCKLLRKIVLPQTVKRIERCAFCGCKYLRSIVLPSQLKKIEEFTFSDCEFLEKIVIPFGVEEIGDHAFEDCSSLKFIKIPGSVKTLDNYMSFCGCSDLKRIELEEGVETLGGAFWACSSVKTIILPKSLKSVYGYSFNFFSALQNVILPKNNPNLVLVDGILYTRDRKCLIRYFPNFRKKETRFVIPKSVRRIDSKAFYECKELEEIIIHDKVLTIGNSAFEECKKLKRIVLPKKLKKLEQMTFWHCSSLSEVVMPSALEEIELGTFADCDSLYHIHIPESVRKIDSAFCHAVREFTVSPDNKHFAAIDGVLYNKKITTLIEMPGGRKIKTIKIPDSVKTIGYNAFRCCNQLKHVIFPRALNWIQTSAFWGCNSLMEVDLPDGVEYISEEAFMDCKSLKHVKLSKRLKQIGDYAFRGCDNLGSLTIPQSVYHIGNGSLPQHLKELHVGYKDPQKAHLYYYPLIDEETILYVPKGTKEKYQQHEIWEDFLNIEEEP